MRTFVAALIVALTVAGPSLAQVVRVEIDAPAETDTSAAIDAAGSVVYTISTGNPFGSNPGYRKQIFRWNPATGAGTQVTSYEEGVETVSVSDDGTWLAFVSNADLLGTNHDESPELFVMQSDGTGLAQLTSSNELPKSSSRVTRAVISGSANRVVFTAPINPFGTNPTLANAVFVIDRNGSNLKQLAIDVGAIVDISDDGSKVIYSKSNQLAGINATGTGNHTFTLTTDIADASISGNGMKVVYAIGSSGFPFALRARTFDGNPATIVSLGPGDKPSITDDATVVYHRRQATPIGIYRINSTGGAATLVSEGLELLDVSGNGARLVGRNTGLVALDNAGGNLQQLTQPTFTPLHPRVEALSADGNRAWYLADVASGRELFAYDFDTGTTTQLTDENEPFLSEDGHFRVSDANDVVFVLNMLQVFKLNSAGQLSQITSGTQIARALHPAIRGDGQEIVFQGLTPQGDVELFRVDGDGGGLAPITTDLGSLIAEIAISEGAPHAWVAYTGEPSWALYRVKTDGSGSQQIAVGAECFSPSISADGNRIAFTSQGDFAVQNADHSFETFLWDAATQTITQLTHTQETYAFVEARITRDGQSVFTANVKIAVDTGVIEPATGFLHPTSSAGGIIPNATGTAWAFNATDVTDRSPSGSSLYRVVPGVAPKIQVGKASPTVVTWDPSPDAIRYDVVRGSISGLSIAGSTVSLGPVVCLEDDSPDNHTRGFEDAAIPAPGEAFFFLYRGSVGFDAAAGSYGQGSGARERIAGAGGCNP